MEIGPEPRASEHFSWPSPGHCRTSQRLLEQFTAPPKDCTWSQSPRLSGCSRTLFVRAVCWASVEVLGGLTQLLVALSDSISSLGATTLPRGWLRADLPVKSLFLQMMDANQRWDVPEAVEWMSKLAKFKPLWIEEPTSPDDILGHAAISKVGKRRLLLGHLIFCLVSQSAGDGS